MCPSVNDNQTFKGSCTCLSTPTDVENETRCKRSLQTTKSFNFFATNSRCPARCGCQENTIQSFLRLPKMVSTRFIFVLVLGFLLVPLASSQSSTEEDASVVKSFDPALQRSDALHPVLPEEHVESRIAVPRIAAVRRERKDKKRKKSRCPKQFRKTFCMNGGRCRWIPDLKEPTCRCKKGWKGDRCQNSQIDIDFATDEKQHNHDTWLIAVVLGGFGVLALIMTSCICWRRFKSVHDDLKDEEAIERESMTMLNGNSVNTTVVDCVKA